MTSDFRTHLEKTLGEIEAAGLRKRERVIATPPHGRVNMGMAGRAHIIRNYSRERMCNETIELYRALIST